MKNYLPKIKSNIQLNGIDNDIINININNVKKEFINRYINIIDNYNILMDEIYWNDLLSNKKICIYNFIPVIGKSYYLYQKNDKYTLSLISPTEWENKFIGEFEYSYNGKWIKKGK